MSYEEDYRRPYKAKCACGKGYIRYFIIHKSNDFGQSRESKTTPEIICDECKEKFHYEEDYPFSYLVPNGYTKKIKEPELKKEYQLTESERFLREKGIEYIEEILADMTDPKHRFQKDLTSIKAKFFAQEWTCRTGKKSLEPMIQYLQSFVKNYESLMRSIEEKAPFVDEYDKKYKDYLDKYWDVEDKSFKLEFKLDTEYERQEELAQENYEKEHEYDDFNAVVHYDNSYKKDFTGLFWDTLYIKKCVDDPYLILKKELYLPSKIVIAKRYKAVCSLCGAEKIIVSSDMKIEYEDWAGYVIKEHCECHEPSSFEVKTMEILNLLGVTYEREVKIQGLNSESGYPLRFDFALYKNIDSEGKPIYDLAIELQGPHHYEQGYYDEYGEYITDESISSEERFKRQVDNDQRKVEFCKDNDIHLETIKYSSSDYERLEKILIEILKENGYKYEK